MSNRFVSITALVVASRPDEPRRPILLSTEQIQARVADAGGRDRARSSRRRDLHLVCVLKGAFVFLADLVRAHAHSTSTLDFMAVSSYAKGTTTTGEVRLLKDLDVALDGRHVVIVEDIVDTGLTLTYLQDILRARGPKTLRTACLLSKPSRRSGRPGGVHRLHHRGPVRRGLRTGLRRTASQPAVHRRARLAAEPRSARSGIGHRGTEATEFLGVATEAQSPQRFLGLPQRHRAHGDSWGSHRDTELTEIFGVARGTELTQILE